MWTKQQNRAKPKSPGAERTDQYEATLFDAGLVRKPYWVPGGQAEVLLRRIAVEMKRRHLADEPQIHAAAVEVLLSSSPPKEGQPRILPRLDEAQLARLQGQLDDLGRETLERVSYLIVHSPPTVLQRLLSHISAVEALLGRAAPKDGIKC